MHEAELHVEWYRRYRSECIATEKITTSDVFRSAIYLLLCRYFVVDLFTYFRHLLDVANPVGMQAVAVDTLGCRLHMAINASLRMARIYYTWPHWRVCACGGGVTAAFSLQWRTNVYPRQLNECPAYSRRIQKNLRVQRPKDEKPTEPMHRSVNTKWICINKLFHRCVCSFTHSRWQ